MAIFFAMLEPVVRSECLVTFFIYEQAQTTYGSMIFYHISWQSSRL
jgi:hypothetical protein